MREKPRRPVTSNVERPLLLASTDSFWPEAVVLVISDVAVATARE